MKRIIDKTTKLFIRDDVSFNEETEIAIDSKPPKFGYNSKWNGTDWEDTRTQEEIDALALEREKQAKLQEKINYLSDTKYVEENYNTLLKVNIEKASQYLASTSDTYGITVQEILEKRAEIVTSIATF